MRYFLIFLVFFSGFAFSDSMPSCATQTISACTTSTNPPCTSSGGLMHVGTISNCSAAYPTAVKYVCAKLDTCSCPSGEHLNTVTQGVSTTTSCIPDEGGETPDDPPICVPGDYNEECPGSSSSAGSCPEGSSFQGWLNGSPVCQPSCSAGYTYGTINGVSGCFDNNGCDSLGTCNAPSSSGSGTSSGTGTSSGSGTSSGTGSGTGTSSGSGTSSGNAGGDGGSGGGGSGGGGGDGDGSGGFGCEFSEFCNSSSSTPNQDDCLPGFHRVIISTDPYLTQCVANSSASSQPSSHASSAASQQSSAASQASSQNGSAASAGTSSAAGEGGGGGGGDEGNGEGDSVALTDCDLQPMCTDGSVECAQLYQAWHTRCGGEFDSKMFELPDKGDDKASFSKAFTDFKTELEKFPNKQHITQFFTLSGGGSCPVWSVDVWVFHVVIDQQCSPVIPWDLISGIIIAVAALVAARIALT